MEDQGRPGDDDLVDRIGAPPLVERDKLRNALGFPEQVEPTPAPPARQHRRRTPLTKVVDLAASNGNATVAASASSALEAVDASPVWRADLNQLYAALSERLRVHGEDVTRQLTEERMRLAGLLTTVVEQVSKVNGGPVSPAGFDVHLLGRVEEVINELTNDRQGLVSVVRSIEDELIDLRKMATPRELSAGSIDELELGSDASTALLAGLERVEARLGEILAALAAAQPNAHPASDDVTDAADDLRRDMVEQLAELRAQRGEERAGRDAWLDSTASRLAARLAQLTGTDPASDNRSTDMEAMIASVRALGRTLSSAVSVLDRGPELALLKQALDELNERHSMEISMEAVADDLDTMRKEIDERLSAIEVALDDIRSMPRAR